MGVAVVFIDQDQAKIFLISDQRMERVALRNRHSAGTPDNFGPMDLLTQVGANIHAANRILVLGPGQMKFDLMAYLSENEPQVAKKVVGCEDASSFSDGDIATRAAKLFRIA